MRRNESAPPALGLRRDSRALVSLDEVRNEAFPSLDGTTVRRRSLLGDHSGQKRESRTTTKSRPRLVEARAEKKKAEEQQRPKMNRRKSSSDFHLQSSREKRDFAKNKSRHKKMDKNGHRCTCRASNSVGQLGERNDSEKDLHKPRTLAQKKKTENKERRCMSISDHQLTCSSLDSVDDSKPRRSKSSEDEDHAEKTRPLEKEGRPTFSTTMMQFSFSGDKASRGKKDLPGERKVKRRDSLGERPKAFSERALLSPSMDHHSDHYEAIHSSRGQSDRETVRVRSGSGDKSSKQRSNGSRRAKAEIQDSQHRQKDTYSPKRRSDEEERRSSLSAHRKVVSDRCIMSPRMAETTKFVAPSVSKGDMFEIYQRTMNH